MLVWRCAGAGNVPSGEDLIPLNGDSCEFGFIALLRRPGGDVAILQRLKTFAGRFMEQVFVSVSLFLALGLVDPQFALVIAVSSMLGGWVGILVSKSIPTRTSDGS
jgi:hypothetical protein